MRLVALYKTFDGDEWIEASLASIYDHVDAIVMVHSDTSWLGERGNTVMRPALKWTAHNDTELKVHHVCGPWHSQEAQYAAGVAYIRERIPFDIVLAVDSDEVWEGRYLERAKEQIAANPDALAFRCQMHTYLKTPFYRVDPPWGLPTTFFRHPELLCGSPRGCRTPAAQLDDVWMHHYTYVRRSPELVLRKIEQSCHADGGEVVVENWKAAVWDRLPDGINLHAFVRWREVWHCVRRLPWSDVPQAVRECEFMRHFWPHGLLMHGEVNELFRLAHGRRQAVDLGTYQGLSAVILGLACERCHTVDGYGDVTVGEYQPLKHDHSLAGNQRLFARFGNITAEAGDTIDAAYRWPGQSVDALFVDADHSAFGTFGNVQAWWPRLTIGARIILHDNNDIHPGVQEAVGWLRNPRLRPVELTEYSGSLVAFDKVAE